MGKLTNTSLRLGILASINLSFLSARIFKCFILFLLMNLIAFSAIAKHSVTDIFLVNPNDAIKMMDADNDGYTSDVDCDDNDPLTYPGAAYNESDTECMTDSDGDGYGDLLAVSPIIPGTDCDDSNNFMNPGGTEIPNNNVDEDCNGLAEVYDLALTTITSSPIDNSIGDTIKFTFIIANEGNTNVDNIVLQVIYV